MDAIHKKFFFSIHFLINFNKILWNLIYLIYYFIAKIVFYLILKNLCVLYILIDFVINIDNLCCMWNNHNFSSV